MPRKISTSVKKADDPSEATKELQTSQQATATKRLKQTAKPIQDTRKRINALWKRKKGLIKKSYFLSRTCAQNVMLAIYDPKLKRLTQFQTSAQFTPQYLQELIEVTATRVKHVTVDDVSRNMMDGNDKSSSDGEDCQNPAVLTNQDQDSVLEFNSPKPTKVKDFIPQSVAKPPQNNMDAKSNPVSPLPNKMMTICKDMTPCTPTKFNPFEQSLMLNTHRNDDYDDKEEAEQDETIFIPAEQNDRSEYDAMTPFQDSKQVQNQNQENIITHDIFSAQKMQPASNSNAQGTAAETMQKDNSVYCTRYLSNNCAEKDLPMKKQLFTGSTNMDEDASDIDGDNEDLVKMTAANESAVMPKPFKVPERRENQDQNDSAANFAFQSVVLMPDSDMFFNGLHEQSGMTSQIFMQQQPLNPQMFPSAQSNKYRSAVLMTTPQGQKNLAFDCQMKMPQISCIFDNDASAVSNVSPLKI